MMSDLTPEELDLVKALNEKYGQLSDLEGVIKLLKFENQKLRSALEFYADEDEWLDFKAYATSDGKPVRVDSHFDGDNGKRAREALGRSDSPK